jgi:hypothetical protein
MAVLLKVQVIAALIKLNKGTGSWLALSDRAAFDVPRIGPGCGCRRVPLMCAGRTQSVSSRRAPDNDKEGHGGSSTEHYGGREIHISIVISRF